MVGRAPGGNGCPGSLEVTALRWLRGHSWLNSWFFRGGPPRSVGSAVTTPRQGPPLETTAGMPAAPRSTAAFSATFHHRGVSSEEGPHRNLSRSPLCSLPRWSPLSVLSLFQPLIIVDFLHGTFLDNLLILMR